jgi:hypothetical protein
LRVRKACPVVRKGPCVPYIKACSPFVVSKRDITNACSPEHATTDTGQTVHKHKHLCSNLHKAIYQLAHNKSSELASISGAICKHVTVIEFAHTT